MPLPLMGLTKFRTCVSIGDSDVPTVAAPLAIQFSVGVGGKNLQPDVLRIQEALNRVPATQGGPTPSLVPDSWIGPNTCGAIKKFQVFHFGQGKADGRVDPNQYTIAKLREFQTTAVAPGCACPPKGVTSRSSLVGTDGPAAVEPTGPTLPVTSLPIMDRVYDSLPTCRLWIAHARVCLNKAIQLRMGHVTDDGVAEATDCLALVDRCFKVASLSDQDALRAMRDIRLVIQKMNQVVIQSVRGVKFFHLAPAGTERRGGVVIQAFTYAGGFTRRGPDGNPPMSHPEYVGPNLSQNGIYMCEPSLRNSTAIHLVDILNHEMAHFAGPEAPADRVLDPAGNLAALALPHHTAMRCASNYAWLTWLARLPRSQWLTDMG